MKLPGALAKLGKRLRKLDHAVANVEDLIERSLHEKKMGKPAPPVTRGDVRTTAADRRKKTK
jgi:hypothetical protein